MATWLKTLTSLFKRDRLKTLEAITGLRLFPNALSGVAVTPENALTSSAVWAAVDVISSAIASIEFEVVEVPIGGGTSKQTAPKHPVYPLVYRAPNRCMTAHTFRRTMMIQALLYGCAWIVVERLDGITPSALWLLDPKNTGYTEVSGVRMIETVWNGETKNLLPDNVITIKGMSLDGCNAVSPVHKAREAIGLALATEQFSATYFGNGAWMGAFIETPANISKVQMDQLREQINEVNQGPANAHKLMGLPMGAKITPNEVDNERAQLNDIRRYQILEVCRFYRIQPTKLMDYTDGTYNNFEQANAEFYNTTLRPWLDLIEAEFTAKLFNYTEYRYSVRHNMTQSVLKGDPLNLAEIATKLCGGPVLTPNEGRALFGLNPIEGGNTLLMPLNMGGIDKGNDPAPEPAPEPSIEALPKPTTYALPAPSEASRAALEAPVRAVAEDVVGRLVRREIAALRRAASKPEGLLGWADTYYAEHAKHACEALAPTAALVAAHRGQPLDAGTLGSRLAEDSRAEVLGLVKSMAPDELPEAIERLCLTWLANRSESVLDSLFGEVS